MQIELIDTHAHLDDEKLRADLPTVLARAAEAGVSFVISVGTTAADSLACVALAATYPAVRATVGIQPNNAAQARPGDWDQIVELVTRSGVVAVGETGLDRYWDATPFSHQEDYFRRHLELAHAHQLPVVIHCREADADVVRMLQERFDGHGPVRGVMHSFTGTWATAEACLALGLHISFAGMVTFKNSEALRKVAARIPLERLLVETDSPYLAPVPVRGKRNEPGFVVHTAACLAGLHSMSPADLAVQTTRNAQSLFKLSG
jgi:TatD DNase family protein